MPDLHHFSTCSPPFDHNHTPGFTHGWDIFWTWNCFYFASYGVVSDRIALLGNRVKTLGWPTVCSFISRKQWVTLLSHSRFFGVPQVPPFVPRSLERSCPVRRHPRPLPLRLLLRMISLPLFPSHQTTKFSLAPSIFSTSSHPIQMIVLRYFIFTVINFPAIILHVCPEPRRVAPLPSAMSKGVDRPITLLFAGFLSSPRALRLCARLWRRLSPPSLSTPAERGICVSPITRH